MPNLKRTTTNEGPAFKRRTAPRPSAGVGVGSARRVPVNRAHKESTRGLSAKMLRAVKAVISNQLEQKLIVIRAASTPTDVVDTDSATGGTATTPTFYSLLPLITKGNGQHQRIGEEVTLTDVKLKIGLSVAQDQVSHGPFLVTLFIGKPRITQVAPPTQPQWLQLLMGDSGVAQGWNSVTSSTRLLPVDDGTWDIKFRKQYKLGVGDSVDAVNNDFSLSIDDEIDCTRFSPKKLLFTALNDQPVSQLFYFFVVTSLNNGAATGGRPNQINTVITRYTDA